MESQILDIYNVPYEIIQDVKCRITDWILSGGSVSDTYVQKQLEFLKKVEYRIIELAEKN